MYINSFGYMCDEIYTMKCKFLVFRAMTTSASVICKKNPYNTNFHALVASLKLKIYVLIYPAASKI